MTFDLKDWLPHQTIGMSFEYQVFVLIALGGMGGICSHSWQTVVGSIPFFNQIRGVAQQGGVVDCDRVLRLRDGGFRCLGNPPGDCPDGENHQRQPIHHRESGSVHASDY